MKASKKIVETAIVKMEIQDDIMIIVIKDDADIDIDNVKEAVEVRKKMQGGKPMLVLIDNTGIWQIDKEANSYSASKEVVALSKAVAVLTDSSLPKRLIGNFFIKLNKQHMPTKLFNNKEKALAWLNSFKD